jgi:hypothetical protein
MVNSNYSILEGFLMASESQVSANRLNAEKSTGPRTRQGKAAVAQNALKHGLLARQNVIRGEDPQEFDLGRRQLLGELEPVGHMEAVLAERIVGLTWRLKRAERLQNQVLDYLLIKEIEDPIWKFPDSLRPKDVEEMTSDPDTDPGLALSRAVKKDYSEEKVLDRLGMYERRIEGSLYRTMAELQRLRLTRKRATDGPLPAGREPMTNCAKQSQFEAVEGGQNPPCETGPDPSELHGQTSLPVPPACDVEMTDSAKQSQFPDPAQSQVAPLGGPDHLSCETKPISGAEIASPQRSS